MSVIEECGCDPDKMLGASLFCPHQLARYEDKIRREYLTTLAGRDMRDYIAGMRWQSVDTAPLMENIIVTYDGTDTFIGYFSDPKLRSTGGRYAIPYGQTECGCGTEEELVLHWQPLPPKPENNDA